MGGHGGKIQNFACSFKSGVVLVFSTIFCSQLLACTPVIVGRTYSHHESTAHSGGGDPDPVMTPPLIGPTPGYDSLRSFNPEPFGSHPQSAFTEVNQFLYGTTSSGGLGFGTLYKVNLNRSAPTVIHAFTRSEGSTSPAKPLFFENKFFGLTLDGGGYGRGIVYSVGIDGSDFQVLHSFTQEEGFYSQGDLVRVDGRLYGTAYVGGPTNLGSIYSLNLDGQDFQVLHYFGGPNDGAQPLSGMMYSDGILYGTTSGGGNFGTGTLFSFSPSSGDFEVLKHLNQSTDGGHPTSAPVIANGALYGVLSDGGQFNGGTIYSIQVDGTDFNVLHAFNSQEGTHPVSGLNYVKNKLVGATLVEGSFSFGTIFSISLEGSDFQILHTFSQDEGCNPRSSPILLGNDLYGATSYCGNSTDSGPGTLYSLRLDGSSFDVLYRFGVLDGKNPSGTLIESGGVLFGTTEAGGAYGKGTLYSMNKDGTNYQILYEFEGIHGESPKSGVILVDNTLFGTTALGGSQNQGTIFSVATDGSGLMTLHEFGSANEGSYQKVSLT